MTMQPPILNLTNVHRVLGMLDNWRDSPAIQWDFGHVYDVARNGRVRGDFCAATFIHISHEGEDAAAFYKKHGVKGFILEFATFTGIEAARVVELMSLFYGGDPHDITPFHFAQNLRAFIIGRT